MAKNQHFLKDEYFFAATKFNPEPHQKGNNFYELGSREMKRQHKKKNNSNPFHKLLKGD